MAAIQNWAPEVFTTSLDGVSSAVTPDLIQPTQIAWGINTINRGATPGTRPPFKFLCSLPGVLVQGVQYFGVQGGMGIVSIDGFIYRLRIGVNDAAAELIPLPWPNSPAIKRVFMQQTVESIVVQDGQSNPIIYNGSVAVRSDPAANGVPRGTMMAYGNGRLWVAINDKELVAGDIRSNVAGSELQFTETNYLSGGGKLFFARGITGLAFIATTGTSDYGALLVFGADYTESIRADITFRDLWAQMPGFVTNVLRHTGCISHWSITSVNQDLYWRDSGGGIRSIRSALADENGPGNAPISREVSRLTDYDSPQLLDFCSGISFNNRLLMTSSPRLNDRFGVTWRDLIPLDFAPISTMRGKTFPAYDGQWQGLNFTHLFQGQFGNKSRAFAVAADDNGANSLWEIMPDGAGELDDSYQICTDGTGVANRSPIQCVVEHGRRSFGDPKLRKRVERCDVYLWDLQGGLDLKVYWRADNNQKWQQWDEIPVCAQVSDPEDPDETVHVWKNLLPQQRPQLKTFTISAAIDGITKYGLQTGFEFQLRLVWTGRTKIYKTVLYSKLLDDPAWSLRDVVDAACLENDVTGNEIIYRIPSEPCNTSYFLRITLDPENATIDGPVFEQFDGPFTFPENSFRGGVDFFTDEVLVGENRVHFSGNFLGISSDHSSGDIPNELAAHGLVDGSQASQWTGSSFYDINTDSFLSNEQVTIKESGAFPDGTNILRGQRPDHTLTADKFGLLFNALLADGTYFVARSYKAHATADGTFLQQWYSHEDAGGGYFAGTALGYIWVQGYTLEVELFNLITPVMLGKTVARTGAPARTQAVISFDPDTNTYTGTKSQAKNSILIPPGKTQLLASYRFLVTPNVGQPYSLYITREYTVTPGTIYEAVIEFPWIVDATVYYVSGSFTFNPSIYQGFSSYVENQNLDVILLPANSTWKSDITFICPPRNADAWDNFDYNDRFPQGAETTLVGLNTGYAWKENYGFVTFDPIDAYDDFESYADGSAGVTLGGFGWLEPGAFSSTTDIGSWDDFEFYADGPATVLDFPGPYWGAAGEFVA